MTSETKLLALIDEYNEKIVDLYNEYYNGVYFAYTFKRYEWKKLRTQEIETWFSNSIERAFKEGRRNEKSSGEHFNITLGYNVISGKRKNGRR